MKRFKLFSLLIVTLAMLMPLSSCTELDSFSGTFYIYIGGFDNPKDNFRRVIKVKGDNTAVYYDKLYNDYYHAYEKWGTNTVAFPEDNDWYYYSGSTELWTYVITEGQIFFSNGWSHSVNTENNTMVGWEKW